MTAVVNGNLPRRLAESGLTEANERLRSRLSIAPLDPADGGYLVPFGECLHWTYSLHEIAEDRMFAVAPQAGA